MINTKFPRQKLSFKAKNRSWRIKHVEWADNFIKLNEHSLRKSYESKKINYDLMAGILNMSDLQTILNPNNIDVSYNTKALQHFPLINNKITLLLGEEWDRDFDFSVSVTNPNAITEMSEQRKQEAFSKIQDWIINASPDEESAKRELEEIVELYQYSWQDIHEINSNYLIKHYYRELDMRTMFNKGFFNPLVSGEEIYRCDIIGGEPFVETVDPFNIQVLLSNNSTKIEDADLILYWSYKSVNKIIDDYYDVLTQKDIDYLDKFSQTGDLTGNGNSIDDTRDNGNYTLAEVAYEPYGQGVLMDNLFFDSSQAHTGYYSDLVDFNGNIRELKVYWKSFRKIKKVKKYNIALGDYSYHFYPETYQIDEALGEEEEILYINEAWEATKIAKDIYVNMRPRIVQYNRISNPSKCHFGFIGEIYTNSNNNPYTLVDMMKPYNYLYDIIHERLIDNIRNNWGKILELDMAKVPSKWDIDKWMYFAKTFKVGVTDSFKEGNKGPAKGKLVGNMNTATKGVIDAETGNNIQVDIQLLEYIKTTIGEFIGVSRQREGQTATRETVGGIERATLQSNYITNWLFARHNSVKKRVIECFIDTGKIAWKGKSLKFKYLLPDKTFKLIEMSGDDFANNDYGINCDDGNETQKAKNNIQQLAQALVQNQMTKASTLIKLYNTNSLSEMTRLFEKDEREALQRQQDAQDSQNKALQQQAEIQQQVEQAKMQLDEAKNIRDNATKLEVAAIQAAANKENSYQKTIAESYKALDKNQDHALAERKREFDERIDLDERKFEFDKTHKTKVLNKSSNSK